MPRTTRRIIGFKGNKLYAEVAPAKNLQLSFPNWLMGGDIVIPKSGRSTTGPNLHATLFEFEDAGYLPSSDCDSAETGESGSESEPGPSDGSSAGSGKKKAGTLRKMNTKHGNKGNFKAKANTKSVRWSDEVSDDSDDSSSEPTYHWRKTVSIKLRKSEAKKKKTTTGSEPSPTASADSQASSTDESSAGEPSPREPSSDKDSSSSDDWTPSEDAIIISMREGGESWITIGKAIFCGEKEVEQRWEELIAEEAAPESESATEASGEDRSDADDELAGGKEKEETKKGRGTIGQGRAKRKKGKPPTYASSSSDDGGESAVKHTESRQYRREEVSAALLGRMYDDTFANKIQSDDHFSPLDCRVLGLLYSKREADHWLELQSAFYNATGRMVPYQLLKRKIEEAEAAEAHNSQFLACNVCHSESSVETHSSRGDIAGIKASPPPRDQHLNANSNLEHLNANNNSTHFTISKANNNDKIHEISNPSCRMKNQSEKSKPSTRGVSNSLDTPPSHDATSMAAKYCDHNKTHGCTNIVAANVKLCDNCKKGNC
ncbi:hypothetical protein QBC33DRAFT_512278 [Phialemonium atrogriseum]|uniref:Myb-like domain-containing protein n=1 Tax=Phialemonium atrogriseum TaxID=1093897 RepID=A0AAJ0FK07_9PEZI|nr:uncharacterized protein QBC33DRAFT_512278 [Phialemonium atrogriseum]KAK1770532.1 hypothetical protein QBC33DRAFT_512278 [Phialemonium atrogriseum]